MNILSKLIAGGLIIQILVAISAVISSRLYAPELFGELGWYLSIASIFSVIAALRFDYLMLSDRVTEKEKNKFFSYAFFINIINLSFICGVALLVNYFFHIKYNIFYLVSFCFGFSFFNLLSQFFIMKREYNKFIIYKSVQILFQIILILIFYFLNNDGLILANIIPQLIVSLIFFLNNRRFISFDFENFKGFLKLNIQEGFKNTFLAFIQYSTPIVPVLFGSYFFDKGQIGAYFLFSQTIAVPFSLIRRNILILFNGEYGSKDKLKDLYDKFFTKKNIIILFFLFFLALLVLFLISKYMVSILFGEMWVNFSWLLILLFIYYFFDTLLQPFTTFYPLWGYVNKAINFEILRFLLVVFFLPLLTYFMQLSFENFVSIFIALMLLVYVLGFISLFNFVKLNRGL